MTDEHLLIAGGTGFLGRYIGARALELGWRLSVLTRNADRAAALYPKGVGCYESLDAVDDLASVSCLVNLAGEPLVNGRWNDARKQIFFDSRVGTTQVLFEGFQRRGISPPIVISGSAVGYYGPQDDAVLDESGLFQDSFSHQLCADWEAAASQFANLGSRVCFIRTGIVLDPQHGALESMLSPFQWGLGGVMGSGRQWMSWIHIRDYVALVFHLMEHSGIDGAVNATAPNPVTNKEFTRTLGKVLGRPTFCRMLSPTAKLIFGEMASELLLSGQRVYPRKVLETGFTFKFSELEPALRDLLTQPEN